MVGKKNGQGMKINSSWLPHTYPVLVEVCSPRILQQLGLQLAKYWHLLRRDEEEMELNYYVLNNTRGICLLAN